MINRNIVLMADRVFTQDEDFDINSDRLEQISDSYYQSLSFALGKISNRVVHYQTPADLIDNISKHREDVVFTVYGGRSSRNRMALVPAICEAYHVRYVGADVYNRILCQDKEVSREIASNAGLRIAKGMVVGGVHETGELHNLRPPVILKPLMEGSSIGISQNSVCYSHNDAAVQCKELIERFNQPVLVEEFVLGREIVVCCIGSPDNVKLCEAVEVYVPSDERYFVDRPYSGDIKHHDSVHVEHRIVTDEIPAREMDCIERLFRSFGKMDYMRIDGRLTDEGFVFVEFTPDAYIGDSSSFADVYRTRGLAYENVLEDIIETALADNQTLFPTLK